MPQITYRANLTASEFPLLSELQGRSVIVPQYDQNFSRQLSSVKNKDRDIGIPQVYYGHNVIPTDAGFATAGYLQLTPPPADTDFSFGAAGHTLVVRDGDDNKAYFAVTGSGRCYVLRDTAVGWLRTTDKAPAAGLPITAAYVNGVTYIYFGGVGCFQYNFGTNTLDPVVLTGLNPVNTYGICAAAGYMLAWTSNTVVWSGLIPTDFTPSLVTGAGGGSVQLIKGNITVCSAAAFGFIVATKTNCVAAVYTGNGQLPFQYKEILNAGGLSSLSTVGYDANTPALIAYTTSGLQNLDSGGANVTFPQVTDFLAGSQFEDFDESTLRFTVTPLAAPLLKRISLISNRYLVISYGINSFTHALVYDYALERWGKLKINHVDCFEYTALNPNVVETPRRGIAFLQQDGTVKTTVMTYDTSGTYGVLVLGKYQLDRNNYITLSEVHLENVKAGADLSLNILTSLDGKNSTPVNATLKTAAGLYRRFDCRTTGVNHSLVLAGSFHISSMELKMFDAGSVR